MEIKDKYIQKSELELDYIKELNPDNYCDSIYTEGFTYNYGAS